MKLKFNFNKRNKYKNICSIEGCNNSACGKYCNKHYHQIKRLGLSKKLWKKYIEASYKYRTNTDKMTASDYTHLFGYLNPYYRSAYNVSKRRK